ncbi:MAG: hypothetical protein IT385_09945 [Deltaproteobacteria bacterium]|nr:hypothetical protein [Deltaproteobacteria bacterium]
MSASRSILVVIVGWAACSERGPATRAIDGPAVAIRVAPLDLVAAHNACYGITVTSQTGDVVWSESGVCADRFGVGGGIAYVGPCDADMSDLPAGDLVNDNVVTLVLEAVYDAPGTSAGDLIDEDDYTNPCGVAGTNWDGFGPCTKVVPCRANADVEVAFDLTIMRRAQQGFFDLAVTFDDIFCSAKLDCIGDPPGLVFDPESGERIASFVLGFACTSGTGPGGAQPTWLYMSDVTLTCEGLPPMTLELSAVTDDGNQGPAGAGVPQWMHMTGEEALGGDDYQKCYWNLAGGLDMTVLAGKDCTLTAAGTAADAAWPGNVPPAGEVRPAITWSVPVLVDGALCDNHALDATGSGVRTRYVGDAVASGGADAPPPFVRARRCGAPPTEVTCQGASDVVMAPATTTVEGEDVPALAVTFGGSTTVFALPEDDAFTIEGCCQTDCCTIR